MNVVEGRIDTGTECRALADDGTRLPLPGLRLPDAWRDRRLAAGLRPEHLLRADGRGDADGSRTGVFEAVVEVVEPIGSEVFVNLRLGGHTLVARLPPGQLPRVGEMLPMRVAVEALHFFDPGNGGQRLDP